MSSEAVFPPSSTGSNTVNTCSTDSKGLRTLPGSAVVPYSIGLAICNFFGCIVLIFLRHGLDGLILLASADDTIANRITYYLISLQ